MLSIGWTRALPISGALLLGSCTKSAEQAAPSETAASQTPAPGAAAPESPPPPAPAEPPSSTTTEDADEGGETKGGLSQPERELTTLAGAETAFDKSKKELEQLVGALQADKAAGGQAPTPLAAGDGRCPRACKAFDSLKRAGDAICRLAGATDARCSKANDLVKQSATRVAACGCKNG